MDYVMRMEDVGDKQDFAFISVLASNGSQYQLEVTYYLDGSPQHKEGFMATGDLQTVFTQLQAQIAALPSAQQI